MRLADYIEANAEAIVDDAEGFATDHLPAGIHLNRDELRDHLPNILAVVVTDLRASQSRSEEVAKAEGQSDTPPGAFSPAQIHGHLRAREGFNINQIIAEYRALRASVLRLWIKGEPPSFVAFDDMIRFNQAIDQAVAESVAFGSATLITQE
jgi:hypothetical protein